MTARFAWCFDHGTMHRFTEGHTPWCTAAWVAFTAATEEEVAEAKQAAYGNAQYFHHLTTEQQLEVIEIAEARQ